MSTRFSREQSAAINSPGNVIVSAGAGSGKTTVMVERVVKKLLAGNKLDKMLIVTFTRASAADIRVKLAERLTRLKRENANDKDVRAVATEALETLTVCNIGTLHSFCQRLIRSYYYAADVDPAAALADDGETKTLKLESIRRAIRAARDGGDKTTCAVLDALSDRRDDEGAVSAVENVIDFALSLSDARGYLSNVPDDASVYAELDAMTETRRDELLAEAERVKNEAAAIEFKALYAAACELDGYLRFGFDLSRMQYRGKDPECAVLYERFKELKDECKAFRADLADAETAKTVESSPYARAVCAVALDALKTYEARKTALGRIDYADLEHGALKVLSDPECMSEIAKTIDFVFIDEYQDVNPLQAEIVSLLKNSAGAEMFLVGDIKQSIYAFRRCNPVFFKNALSDTDYTRVLLNRNYRSSTEVIDFVNKVFTGVMSDGFGGADYNADKLICGSPSHGAAEFYAVNAEADGAKKTVAADGEKKTAEKPYSVMNAVKGVEREDEQARLIVDLILDYADGGAGFGSIAVLVRSARTPFCDGLVRLMRANGIPCNLGRKSKASDYPEAEALLRIARCVDNRFDDVALYTALRSPMGGFGDDELLQIATAGETLAVKAGVEPEFGFGAGRRSYCFWQKVRAYKGEYSARLDSFFARRDALADFARSHDAADALGRITSETDYFQYVFENGGNASAVESLISLAAAKKCSLSTFLVGADDTELTVGDGVDAVTITTIHASKGLEYDFVIVADIGRRFNMRDASDKCMTAGGGVAVKFPDEKERTLKCSARWLLERYAVPDRMRAEELRLFYVALTRAKKRLVVCGRPSRTAHEPTAAACEYDFMKNVAARRFEFIPREIENQSVELPLDRAIIAAVKSRMTDDYQIKDVPIKTCVTAIAERSDDYTYFAPVLTYDDRAANEDEWDRKLDMTNTLGADAARRGTAYHRAMELIDFSSPDVEAVKQSLDDGELVDFDAVLYAVAEMKKLTDGARAYFKERYFIVDMPIDGENTLVQGVIDLLIINADGTATIVDYKTTDPSHLLSDNYLRQLSLYAAAVEKSSPLKVSSTYLYSFVLGKAIKCGRK